MKPVEIYTTPICPYCHAAKRLLAKKGVPFTEIDVSRDPSLRDAMTELMSTVNDSLLEISGDPEYALHMFSSFTPYRLDAEATWDRAAQAREGRRPPAARRGAGKVPTGGGWGGSRHGFPPSTLRPTAHSGAVAAVRLVAGENAPAWRCRSAARSWLSAPTAYGNGTCILRQGASQLPRRPPPSFPRRPLGI